MAQRGKSTRSVALTAQQRSFINLLLANNFDKAQTAAAKGISVHVMRKWFQNPRFKEYLQQRQAILDSVAEITQQEVVALLVSHARADLGDVLPDEPIIQQARANGVSHLIKKLKVTETEHRDGRIEKKVEIEIHDPSKALSLLTDMLGLKNRDDDLERARTAIRAAIALNGFSPEEAIRRLAPHFPAVVRLRDEFCGRVIDVPLLENGEA